MMKRHEIFIKNIRICGTIVFALMSITGAHAANVVPRGSTQSSANRVSATRPSVAAVRMPTMTVNSEPQQSVSTTLTETDTEPEIVTTPDETTPVANKAETFSATLETQSLNTVDAAAANLAELIRAQRAALDAADAATVADTLSRDLSGNGANLCDATLRACMIQRCGSNFANCVKDTATTFGDKLDTCRRTTNCSGHEYQLFAAEIRADRDLNAQLSEYNKIVDCGTRYDSCIVAQCGSNYSRCLGKTAGDNAIAKCESVAKSCTEYDSGLAMRTMGVLGEFRQNAERQIATDEKKLYALREQMRDLCTRLGAMFDERSLDCVYTVNFYAGNDSTLYASKKSYAGDTFDCTTNWFGIDITTFRENAYRETRAQTAASSAMLGAGLGIATGSLTSGAITNAIDRHNAGEAVKSAESEETSANTTTDGGGNNTINEGTTTQDRLYDDTIETSVRQNMKNIVDKNSPERTTRTKNNSSDSGATQRTDQEEEYYGKNGEPIA